MAHQPSVQSLEPDRVVGPCKIVRRLGAGGMGEVYLAEHIGLRKKVAVKILPPRDMSDAAVRRFMKEAQACASIDHPNVVTIHDFGEDRGLYYIVMKYVDGRDLATVVKDSRGPIPWRAAVRFSKAAAAGLQAAHDKQLIHRDIKPGNIMLAADERVILMDFGLVRDDSESRLTQAGIVMGTRAFMPPEQALAQRVDTRSDIYSLGATLYFLLVAKLPFGDGNGYQRLVTGVPAQAACNVNPRVPAGLSDLVAKAMSPKANDRFPTAAAFGEALAAFEESPAAWTATIRPNPIIQSFERLTVRPISIQPAEGIQTRLTIRMPSRHLAMIVGGAVIALLSILLAFNIVARLSEKTVESPGTSAASTANMVRIPGGTVQMGNNHQQVLDHIDQVLQGLFPAPELQEQLNSPEIRAQFKLQIEQLLEAETRVQLDEFWIDKTEVSNREYAEFLRATNHEPPESWHNGSPPVGQEDHPVENIRYRDAEAYAIWRGKKLPTPEQWTRAFRGEHAWLFPWGDQYGSLRANTVENTAGSTTPVQATPQDISPYGVLNMVGNVSEFVSGRTTVQGQAAVFFKGASYRSFGIGDGIGGLRQVLPSGSATPGLGFRCVVEKRLPSRS